MVFVILPAFNEERVIRPTLIALWQAMGGCNFEYRAILVDDGSFDHTVIEAERAAEMSQGTLPLTILRHKMNSGLGAALRTGIYWCLDRATDDDVIVTLDADNTHPPSLIPALLNQLDKGYDLAIASRYRVGAKVTGVPPYRRLLSDFARLVFQSMFPIPGVRDYTCCFRAYRTPLLRKARLVYGEDLCTARGFEAVMDILLKIRPLGVQAIEVPLELNYGERIGQSKMKVLKTICTTLALLSRRFIEQQFPQTLT